MDAPISATVVYAAIGLMIVWQAGLWCLASWVTAWISGWRALAVRYPHRAHARPRERAGGMLMIGERWGGSMSVHADDDGIAVLPAWLMAIGRRPLLFPWSGIVPLARIGSPIVASLHFTLDGKPIALFGKAAEFVEHALAARSSASTPSQSPAERASAPMSANP